MSGSGRVGAQPYQIENECSVGSSFHNRLQGRRELLAVAFVHVQSTGVTVAGRILHGLRDILVGDRGLPAHVTESLVVERTGVERREQAARSLPRIAHHRRVQQQNGALGRRLSVIQRDVGQRVAAITGSTVR